MEYLYIIKQSMTVKQIKYLYKIGRSQHPENRLVELQVGNPYILVIIGKYECKDSINCERDVHIKFKDYNINGEWFEFNSDELIDCIEYINVLVKKINKNSKNINKNINYKSINHKNTDKQCKYMCLKCNYSTDDKSNYNRHIKSVVCEQSSSNYNAIIIHQPINTNTFICSCGKNFLYASGLSRHKKDCKYEYSNDKCKQNGVNIKEFELLKKQLQEYQKQQQLIEHQQKEILKKHHRDLKIKEIETENKFLKKEIELIKEQNTEFESFIDHSDYNEY